MPRVAPHLPLREGLPEVLPILAILSVVGLGAGAEVLSALVSAILARLRAHARALGESSPLVKGLSRSLLMLTRKEKLLRSMRSPSFWARAALFLAGSRAFLGVSRSMAESLRLTRPVESVLDENMHRRWLTDRTKPRFGKGLKKPPSPGIWQPYLYQNKNAYENLEAIHAFIGIVARPKEQMTFEQLTEGVRRTLLARHNELVQATDNYWSLQDVQSIARALAADCKLTNMQEQGGLEELSPEGMPRLLPWATPPVFQSAIRWGIASMRPVMLDIFGWTSRYIKTPYGQLHVYDTNPSELGTEAMPPLILQHGMFVTGWCMILLGKLLNRSGRRLIIPDMFDVDHGLSSSESSKRGQPVRSVTDRLTCMLCIAQDLLDQGVKTFDLLGHSFGGFMAGKFATECERLDLPLRKVVMLSPGGPVVKQFYDPDLARFFNDPISVVLSAKPWFVPAALATGLTKTVLGVFLGANNCNTVLNVRYNDYFGCKVWGSKYPTLLLWGDQDHVTVPRDDYVLMKLLQDYMPRLDAYWVENAGHNINFDAVVTVANAVESWLDTGKCDGSMKRFSDYPLFMTRTKLKPFDFSSKSEVPAALKQAPAAKL